MSIRGIAITCDTPDCGAFCEVNAHNVADARERAAGRFEWTSIPDGRDYCGPCTRNRTAALEAS